MAGANVSFGGKTPITDPTKVAQIFGQDNAGVTGPMALGVLKTALGTGTVGGASALVLTSNPTVATDSSAGAVTGILAIVKPTGRVFICRDATAGAAVWEPFDASVGYKSGNYYGFDGAKVKGSSPDVAQPAVAGQHMLQLVRVTERVTIQNLNFRCTTAVAGTLLQAGFYKIDPTTKRPIGAVFGQTGDIDVGSAGYKTGAPLSALTLEAGVYALDTVCNNATTGASTLVCCDSGDGSFAQKFWGDATLANLFGGFYGLFVNGTYGTFPTFGASQVFQPKLSVMPHAVFQAGDLPS